MSGSQVLPDPEDELHERLLRAGALWRDNQPATAEPLLPQGRLARHLPRWAPLAAAAAVAVVAAGAVLLPGQAPQPSGPVPIVALVAQADGRDKDNRAAAKTDAALPPLGPQPRRIADRDCRSGEVAATLTLGAGSGTLVMTGGAPLEQACELPGTTPSLRVLDGGATKEVPTTYPVQRPVPNPPQRTDDVLRAGEPLSAALTWDSWCGPREGRLELVGLAAQPVPVAVTGDLPPCDTRTSPVRLERLTHDEASTSLVPPDRAGLRVVVEYPDEVPPGFVRPYTVRLQNPTRKPISLRPCPTFLLHQENPISGTATGGTSSTSTAALPCDDLPDRLASGHEATVLLEARFGVQDPKLRGIQRLQTWWGIAGTEPHVQDLPMRFSDPPRPVADVPWADTAVPPGSPGEVKVGDPLPYAPLQPTIEGLPERARAGDVLRYAVRLTNTASGGPPVPLEPCPGFVQYLQVGVRQERQELIDERYINCEQAPTAIAAGTSILLRMELAIPAGAEGEALLTWKIGKLDNAGSPSDFAKFVVSP